MQLREKQRSLTKPFSGRGVPRPLLVDVSKFRRYGPRPLSAGVRLLEEIEMLGSFEVAKLLVFR